MKNKPSMLLVDFNNLLYRSMFANLTLSYKGIFTGGIYGFINMISAAVNRYEIDRILVCNDTKPYHRSTYYPAYKQDRTSSMDEDAVAQLAVARGQIKSLIQGLSIPLVAGPGWEADDYIGKYCRSRRQVHSRIFIMSNDSDFYQLLGGNPGQVFLVKNTGLYGQHQFCKDYPDIMPEDWPRIIALKGGHNGVPGFVGIGDKTAIRLLRDWDADIQKRYAVTASAGAKTISDRTELARFPFPKVHGPRLPFLRGKPIHYDAEDFEEVCNKYGIQFKTEFHNAFLRLSK